MRKLLAVTRYEFYSNVKSYQIVLNRETFGSPVQFLNFFNYFLFNSLRGKRNDKELLSMYFVSSKVQRKENVDGSILF